MRPTKMMIDAGWGQTDIAFENFMNELRPSLKLWDYFVNWDKVFRNTRRAEIDLNILNYLLGKKDFDNEFLKLLEEHPTVVRVIPTLVVRDGKGSENFAIVSDISDLTSPELLFDFRIPADTPKQRQDALTFIKMSGLQRLFTDGGVKNLVDYVLGVEAGVDSNGRKNRSGTAMETVVEEYLRGFCGESGLTYQKQATAPAIQAQWGFTVPVDKSSRRFDFAISDGENLVLMEVNFYGGGGSKLKATAGEYIGLNQIITEQGHTFVWVTDGIGWRTTHLPLREAFEKIDFLWNLNWLGNGYLRDLFPTKL